MLLGLLALTVLAASPCETKVCFSPEGKCDKVLIKTIQTAKTTLDVQVYYLTHKGIVQAILAARSRKVSVRVIVDDTAAKTRDMAAQLKLLKSAGIPIETDWSGAIMHSKVALVDKSCLVTGSFNFTQQATAKNDENLLILNDSKIVQEYQKQFDKRWKKYRKY